MSVIERQSRRARSKRPLDVRIGPRDVEIFKLLSRYRFLRKSALDAFVGGNPFALQTRLGELYRAHYLNRPSQQWDYFNSNYRPAIYELDKRGEDELTRRGLTERPVAVFKHLYNEFAHNVMLCDVLANLELGARQFGATIHFYPGEVKIPATIAHTFSNKKSASSADAYNPDAAFQVEYPSGKTLCFTLEVDTGSETLVREGDLKAVSYLKKLLQLKHVMQTTSYKKIGFEQLFALHVTNSETRKKNIMALCATLDPSQKSKSNLFSTHPVLGDYRVDENQKYVATEPSFDGRLFGVWERVGQEPFNFKEKAAVFKPRPSAVLLPRGS